MTAQRSTTTATSRTTTATTRPELQQHGDVGVDVELGGRHQPAVESGRAALGEVLADPLVELRTELVGLAFVAGERVFAHEARGQLVGRGLAGLLGPGPPRGLGPVAGVA